MTYRTSIVPQALALLVSGATLGACTSSSSGAPIDAGTTPENDGGASPQADAGVDASVSLTVTPATANVLTCDTLQFQESGGAGNGAWSVAPAGTIDPKGGLFSAPLTAPASPASTIMYAESDATGTATVQLATAFPGPAATLPTTSNPNAAGFGIPFEHTFTANGARVYTVAANAGTGSALLEADVYVSNDSGKTFTAGAAYHTGDLTPGCVTVAVDAADPDVVYLTYLAGHGDSTSNTGQTVRLAVSTDGAKTFPVEYIVADSPNSIANFICPDVSSPSADHVIVSGIIAVAGSEEAATFVSANRGAGIGPVGQQGVSAPANPANTASPYSASDTNGAAALANCSLASNGSGAGPRVFTNGKGDACVAYTSSFGTCNPTDGGTGTSFIVQCSADSGATWSPITVIATPNAQDTTNQLFGAVSPGGNVALTWLDQVGSSNEIFVAVSKDGGKTFGARVQYPSASRNAAVQGSYTVNPVVTWQSDGILWLTQTLDGSDTPAILVDKTCDFGISWSGALNAGVYEGTTLLSTATGMVVTGWVKGHTSSITLPLALNAY